MHIGLYKTIQDNETLFVNRLLPHNLNVHQVTKRCHTHIFCHQMKVMFVCVGLLSFTHRTLAKKKAHGVFVAQDGSGRFPSANKT